MMMGRRTIIILVGSLAAIVLLTGILSSGPPVAITFVGKTGRKYDSSVLLDFRLQNHRLWPIYYHGQGRISVRTDSGWREMKTEQYPYAFSGVPERIGPRKSTTIWVRATETDSTNEAKVGLDYYRRWDCDLLWRWWNHPRTLVSTVWSEPEYVGFVSNTNAIRIMVEEDGSLGVAGTRLTADVLTAILRKACAEYGRDIPIVVTSRKGTDHRTVSPVVDICASTGITNIMLNTIDASLGAPTNSR
jgi:hypothetical protein